MKKNDEVVRDIISEIVNKHFSKKDIRREKRNKALKEERKETITMILSMPLLVGIIFVVGLAGIIGRVLLEMLCLVVGRRP